MCVCVSICAFTVRSVRHCLSIRQKRCITVLNVFPNLASDLSMCCPWHRHPSVTSFILLSVSSALTQRRRRMKARRQTPPRSKERKRNQRLWCCCLIFLPPAVSVSSMRQSQVRQRWRANFIALKIQSVWRRSLKQHEFYSLWIVFAVAIIATRAAFKRSQKSVFVLCVINL